MEIENQGKNLSVGSVIPIYLEEEVNVVVDELNDLGERIGEKPEKQKRKIKVMVTVPKMSETATIRILQSRHRTASLILAKAWKNYSEHQQTLNDKFEVKVEDAPPDFNAVMGTPQNKPENSEEATVGDLLEHMAASGGEAPEKASAGDEIEPPKRVTRFVHTKAEFDPMKALEESGKLAEVLEKADSTFSKVSDDIIHKVTPYIFDILSGNGQPIAFDIPARDGKITSKVWRSLELHEKIIVAQIVREIVLNPVLEATAQGASLSETGNLPRG